MWTVQLQEAELISRFILMAITSHRESYSEISDFKRGKRDFALTYALFLPVLVFK